MLGNDAENDARQPLSPYMTRLELDLLILRQDAEALTALNEVQWSWSPQRNTWSVVQILDHLNKSGTVVIPLFESAISRVASDETAVIGDRRMDFSLTERLFNWAVGPNSIIKFPVPAMLEPSVSGLQPQSVLNEFISLQGGLLECVRKGSGLDLTRVKITSPVDSRFKPCVGAYLEGTVRHEQYHWLQVTALRANPGFPP